MSFITPSTLVWRNYVHSAFSDSRWSKPKPYQVGVLLMFLRTKAGDVCFAVNLSDMK